MGPRGRDEQINQARPAHVVGNELGSKSNGIEKESQIARGGRTQTDLLGEDVARQNMENCQDGRREGIEIENAPGEGDDLRAGGLLFDGHGSDGGGWNEKTMIGKRFEDHEIFRQGGPLRDCTRDRKGGSPARCPGTGTRPDASHVIGHRTSRTLAIHSSISVDSHLLPAFPRSQRHRERVIVIPLVPSFHLHNFSNALPPSSSFFLLTISF